MDSDEFDRLNEQDRQVVARQTTDHHLQEHIIWRGCTSCWPFLAANAAALSPELLEQFAMIVTAHHRQPDPTIESRGAFANLGLYAPDALRRAGTN